MPITIHDSDVQITEKCEFLGVTLSHDLNWSSNTTKIAKKARQCLFFLRRLREFAQNNKILLNFYYCVIERVLTSCITVWFGNLTLKEKKALNKVVRSASRIIGYTLPLLEVTYKARLLNRALKLANDALGHPAGAFFEMLPSGRRYRSVKCSTDRHFNSFFPQAVITLNKAP